MPFIRKPERRTINSCGEINRRNKVRRSLGINWISLFHDIDENIVQDALADSEVLLLSAGTTLLKPGETNQNVYVLLSGEIGVHLENNLSQHPGINISPGECIGELSVIDGKPVSALILARTDVRVLKLSQEVFWYRLMIVPGIARNLMTTLTERMRRSNELTLKAQREQLELIHIKKELDLARQLQSCMLPPQYPLFRERLDIQVCGFMEPASDVGGDLFDAFFVDEHLLFFCIGDVSGHGIAAAMFMARTIGLLHILAMNHKQPDQLLSKLNDRLCVGNDTHIFITLFCGFLDLRCGKLSYSNGGHCAPVLFTHGKAKQLAIPKGALIGAFSDIKYSSMEYILNLGDMLFCYTDGVTEAQNQQNEAFSEGRCLDIIEQTGSLSLPSLLETMRQEVVKFTNSEILDDDCTMLAIRYPVAISMGPQCINGIDRGRLD